MMSWKTAIMGFCLIFMKLDTSAQDLLPSYYINLGDVDSSGSMTADEMVSRVAIQGALKSSVALGEVINPLIESHISLLVVEETVVRSPSVMHVIVLDVTFRTFHKGNGQSFSQNTFTIKGTGSTQNGAKISAVRSLQRLSAQIAGHYLDAKTKINEYFESECTNILSKTKQIVSSHGVDAALVALDKIPSGAAPCYQRGLQLADDLIAQNEQEKCSSFMLGPKAKWSASKSRTSAMEVSDMLASFYPGLSCDKEIQELLEEVAAVIAQYDASRAALIRKQRERAERLLDDQIAFERKKYEDGQTLLNRQQQSDNEYRTLKLNSDTALRSQENMVKRDVGMAMANALGRSDGWMAVFN